MDLKTAYNNVARYPNGNQVARRMAQLHDFSLDPEHESLKPGIEHLFIGIKASEEVLLRRSPRQVGVEGSVLRDFRNALKDSTPEDWQQFKQEINLLPLSQQDQEQLRNYSQDTNPKGFLNWVLGNEGTPGRKEVK
jgi:RNase P/RNase MRP subunit p29